MRFTAQSELSLHRAIDFVHLLYVVLVDLPHHGVPASCGGHLRNSARSLRTFGPPDNHQPTETMQHHFSPTSFFEGSAVSALRHYNKTRGKAATSITMILRDESFRTSSGRRWTRERD
jgi:hypothetical protein